MNAGGGNLWAETAPDEPHAPPLGEEAVADVVVVGAGFTGCAAALALAEGGRSVRVLEAETIGHGGSGRNVGLVNAGLWMPPDAVEATLGPEAGARLNERLAEGPQTVFGLIERHAIACEATRTGTLHLAHAHAGLAGLDRRHAQYRARGWPVERLGPRETRRRTGTGAYAGALLDPRAGTIQPLGYVRGLAGAAIVAGARFHARSPALEARRTGAGWRVKTPGGAVLAEWLVMATNGYHTALQGLPAPRFTPVHYFQCATPPLGHNTLASLLPDRQGAWDTARVMSSFRLDGAGRLILGAMGSLEAAGAAIHRDWARRTLERLFPDAMAEGFAHAWSGRIAMTRTHLPRIVRLAHRAIGIHGYSGRGIAPGTVFGTGIGRYVLTGDEDALPLAPVETFEERFNHAHGLVLETAAAVVHAVSGRLRGGPRRRGPEDRGGMDGGDTIT